MDEQNYLAQHDEFVRKSRRRHLALIAVLLAVVIVLGSIFLAVACRYQSTDFSFILARDDAFDCAEGFLYPRGTDEYRASYNLSTGLFFRYETQEMDLTPYGIDASYSHFRYLPTDAEDAGAGRIIPTAIQDLPLSRANTETRFVYAAEDGKKWLVDLATGSSAPLFAGSAEGVDIYGTDITAFSHAGGLYAAGLSDGTLSIYLRENADSFRVTKFHTVAVPSGDRAEFFFCSDTHIQLTVRGEDGKCDYYVIDVRSGVMLECPLPDARAYTGPSVMNPYCRLYAEVVRTDEEETGRLRYVNASLGTEFVHELPDRTTARLRSVSAGGEHALLDLQSEDGTVPTVCRTGGRQRDLRAILPEGTGPITDALFLADSILLVNYENGQGVPQSLICKICY